MKTILYTTPGATIQGGTTQPMSVSVELPYTPANLERAEAEAIPGTLLIRESSEDAQLLDAKDRLVLKDRATGKLFELYVETGKLMMEVI